ncbi:MAG: phage portal protein [Phycisphaerales bacterium]|nr:phage portal protein [Phycisphaerales bacterium]
MALALEPFEDIGISEQLIESLVAEHQAQTQPALERLWSYYRNPVRLPGSGKGDHGSAQEAGLPVRLTGAAKGLLRDDRGRERETVIENDIGWRVDALVDFVFGKPVRVVSTADDSTLRDAIERVLDAVWEASGGIQLLQDMALLGGVYGHVDLVVRGDALTTEPGSRRSEPRDVAIEEVVQTAKEGVRIELIEAQRGIPVLDPGDYRRVIAYIIRSEQLTNDIAPPSFNGTTRRRIAWLLERNGQASRAGQRVQREALEVLSSNARQVYLDRKLVLSASGPGELPVVHIQNASQPFTYRGRSDVEGLIPLQDELNTRLSDRAHRVTMQSFRMYLAKGIDGLGEQGSGATIAPGQVWVTDNPDATIDAFGGDLYAPSETEHIDQIREAMDKTSGVSPIVLGLLRAKVGHLSSENALRITLMGVLSKTERKRQTYGRGILQASSIVLRMLDRAGVLKTNPKDRGLALQWLDPLPLDENKRLQAAQLKLQLGVPQERVLSELGYGDTDPGVV